MFPSTIATSLLLGSQLAAAGLIQRETTQLVNSTACSNVHILIARGTTETYPGSLETLAELITANNADTTYENLVYPATSETTTDSYHVGKKAARKQLTSFVERCGHTDSKLVVLAYSQGAMIIADTLAGGGGDSTLGNLTAPIDYDIGKHIDALVLYGDPRHAPNQPYNQGYETFNVTGKYPRPEFQVRYLTEHYGKVIHDFCNVNDPVCASGTNLTAHLVYPEIWDTTAAGWVQSVLDKQ
ncbi:hypothetical protein N7466_004378 [Penicillium verhagenii]|uniref:uncharacterized protein n=1 Tax=Penicillium verhagenii TaxID=1562060 RepID=UPI0025450AE7|nr:uncharacterized protein N7466_004378 [Penicillium verhagenii]KAJ5934831.1 hypothetical protein N7466_004378 [Penicillium verhagenii]